ncbi:hypothetical protein [Marinobacterium stanieri]|uniref:hypothetical protein n=1 Tax=Marinobacterium stanieri TaxID=49186 RepID=UPI000255A0E6|nr:hypothetical protein [Marinobacterium stanieri]
MNQANFTYSMAANMDMIAIGLEQMNLLVMLASRAGELDKKQQSILFGDLRGRIEELEQACVDIQTEVEA